MSRVRNKRVLTKLYSVIDESFRLGPGERPHPGERIDDHLNRVGWESDLDFLIINMGCEEAFPLRLERSEWISFFEGGAESLEEWRRDVAPHLTYERLADFIAGHLPRISFEPVEIGGRNCGPAGAYYGIREASEQILRRVKVFGPSTRILRHLGRSQVELVWRRLAWEYGDRLPPLRRCPADGLANATLVWVFTWGMVAAAFLHLGEPDLTLVFGMLASLLLVPYFVLRVRENPLPDGIVTFGDLARRLAEAGVPDPR